MLRHAGQRSALPVSVPLQPEDMAVPSGTCIVAGNVLLPGGVQHTPFPVTADGSIPIQQGRGILWRVILIKIQAAVDCVIHGLCYLIPLPVKVGPFVTDFHRGQGLVIKAACGRIGNAVQKVSVRIGKNNSAALGCRIIVRVTVSGCPHTPHTGQIIPIQSIAIVQFGSAAHHAGAFAYTAGVDVIGPCIALPVMLAGAECTGIFGGERRLIAAALRIIHRGRGAEKMPAQTAVGAAFNRPVGDTGQQDGAVTFHQAPFSVHAHRIIAVCGKPVLRQQLAASGILLLQLDGRIFTGCGFICWVGLAGRGSFRCLGGRCRRRRCADHISRP